MKRTIVCIIETICIICIPIFIALPFYFKWNSYKESFKYELEINEQNKSKIETYVKNNLERESLEGAVKIQYYSKLHHNEYTIYYDDGFQDTFMNDDIDDLLGY